MNPLARCAAFGLAILAAITVSACSGKKPVPDDQVSEAPPATDAVVMPKGAPLVQRGGEAPSDATGETGETGEDGADDAAAEAATVTRAALEQFLERGPSYVLTVVTVDPIHRDNQFQGYQITEVTRGAREFMTPQVRVGDIVTHVNGVRMSRPDDFMQAWRSLDRVSTIRIDFLRQNQPMNAVWVVR